jgi:RNA recognition motif-containing protein
MIAILEDRGDLFLTRVCQTIFKVRKKEMETKLFVGNLSYDTTDESLRTLLSQAGAVSSVELIKDRDTGRSKGFAFIQMGSQAEVENAIRMFDGYTLDNRQIKVNLAKPREERPRGGGWYNDRPYKSGGNKGRQDRSSRRY